MLGVSIMARPSGEMTRCDGAWTESKFNNFIRNQLRSGTRKWAPIQKVKKEANVRRGVYLCAGCKKEVPNTTKEGRARKTNIFVDHINPIVNPETGFVSYDEYINRMFCEKENLQLLCKKCHDVKTKEETAVAQQRREREKDGK